MKESELNKVLDSLKRQNFKYMDKQKQDELRTTARDLIRKGHLTQTFANRLGQDPRIWMASMWNFNKESFVVWMCPQCGLGPIQAPKEWIKDHIKTHFRPDSKKENEMQVTESHPYRN